MDMVKLRAVSVVVLTLCTTAFLQDPKPKPKTAPGPLVTIHGEKSAIDKTHYVKVSDKAAWAKLWCQHIGKPFRGAYSWHYNESNVPNIDFKQCMVVAVFQGTKWNSAGVRVEEVLNAEELTLRFDDLGFQTSGPDGGGVKNRPFGMFVLPRSDKVIVLEENVQSRIGKPPTWKARGKL